MRDPGYGRPLPDRGRAPSAPVRPALGSVPPGRRREAGKTIAI